MTQTRPVLPPKARGPLARRLAAAAACGTLELPVCEECGTSQYPLRERCVRCSSGALEWRVMDSKGVVLARTTIRHSTEAFFQARRPIPICSVQLDSGPVLIAFAAKDGAEPGQRVRVLNWLDRSGEAVFVAVGEGASREMGNVMSDPNCEIAGKIVLITGGGDPVGRELDAAFKNAGAKEVITAGENSSELQDRLDVTNIDSVERLAASAGSRVDILVNNLLFSGGQRTFAKSVGPAARREMDVNYFGLLNVLRAFSPVLRKRGQGVIVNVLSVWGQVGLPLMGTFSASQAAALSLTQTVRAELAPWGVRVCSILPAALDTPVYSGLPLPKLAPRQLAAAVVKALMEGVEDVYPGADAEGIHCRLRDDAKAVEKELAAQFPL
jgi:NAD(P)-dependent dehydrogenase (short-subunit alcohol dehydrogenase family)/uncharacterized OB-fold protein